MEIKLDGAYIPATELLPLQAVVFFSDDGKRIVTATVHDMTMEPHGAVAGAGRALTVESLKGLARLASESLRRKPEILPERVLVATDDLLIWWRRAGAEYLTFDVDWHEGAPGRERLQGVTHHMPLPPLVFVMSRSTAGNGIFQGVYVVALSEDRRPGMDTAVFRAPLLNLNTNGNVCWGNGERPKGRNVGDIEAWERFFFSSTFTHVNEDSPLKSNEPYRWIADFCESKKPDFPVDQLKPTRQVLGDLIGHHAGDQE